MKDDVKMVQDPPRVDVDASVINRSMLVFISMRKFLTKCNVCYALDNLFCTRLGCGWNIWPLCMWLTWEGVGGVTFHILGWPTLSRWTMRVCVSATRNVGSRRRRRGRRRRRWRRRRRRRRRRSTGHIPHSGAAASPWWPGGARPCISVCTTWQGGPGLGRPAGCPKFYLAGPRPPLSPAGSNHRHAATALQHSDQQLVTSKRLTNHLFQITACLVRMAEKEAVGRPWVDLWGRSWRSWWSELLGRLCDNMDSKMRERFQHRLSPQLFSSGSKRAQWQRNASAFIFPVKCKESSFSWEF